MGKPTILITGCSDGGLGSVLALEFHAKGQFRVFATARNENKLKNVKAAGIVTLSLDVLSEESIKACVAQLRELTGGSLDIFVNNAGAQYLSSVAEASIDEGKKLFDINVWSNVATVQGFLPLLLRSKRGGIVVNHTSILSLISPPFVGFYSASKAAAASLTVALRSELSPFGIRVVELKSGETKSNLNDSLPEHKSIPQTSLYWPARDRLDKMLSGQSLEGNAIPTTEWAQKVVHALSKKNPADTLYFGGGATSTWFATTFLPNSAVRTAVENFVKFSEIKKSITAYGMDRSIANAYGAF